MAASAYGAVVSLMHVLDNIQHPARRQLHFDRNQIETLRQKVGFLLEFLEDYSQILCHADTEDLARQIAYAADEAEEVIDYHVVDQISQRSAYNVEMGLSSFREDLDRVLNKIESIKKQLMVVKDQKRAVKEPQPRVSRPAAGSSSPPWSGKINTMVGFDEHLLHIMDQLTGDELDLQIVPITGMGGIGKTTLAQNAFDNRCIVDRFDLRKWITISQSYSIQDVLLGFLWERDNQNNKESKAELGGKLHKMLFGRRYLIVMDDVWSTEVWDKLGLFFPNNRNGSRIIVTTRLSNVAVSIGSQDPYLIDFLNKEESWNLFCLKAFGKKVCPNPRLEKIGKDIVECCKGLPLAISIIGGLLGKSNMAAEDWELVAEDVMKSLANPKDVMEPHDNSKDDEDCSSILSLSYKHLPIHLKPCFLYMRIFPEDSMIDVDPLIHYWIAEGFVKPKEGKTLEDVASEYLKDLIDRNLILFHQLDRRTGKMETCKVHDLLRDLCIREYEKEHFFCISKVGEGDKYSHTRTCSLCCYRKASTWIYLPEVTPIISLPTTRALCYVCDVCNIMYSQHNKIRLVKVARDRLERKKYLISTRLRYLKVSSYDHFESSSLPLLWNLQFVIVDVFNKGITELPLEIWEMPQLRYLHVPSVLFVDPPATQIGSKDYVILENLQTLEGIKDFRCSEEILKRIPNIKTLKIVYNEDSKELVHLNHLFRNLSDLHKLDMFFCGHINLENISFPISLKTLRIYKPNCPWESMTIIGSLPNLEFLALVGNLEGPEWNPVEGEFLQLKLLCISYNGLVRWNAEKHHFPKLEILELDDMECLEEIPSEIGKIETLREIRLSSTTKSVVQSAQEIIEEQRSYGNEELQLIHIEVFQKISPEEDQKMCQEAIQSAEKIMEEQWSYGNEDLIQKYMQSLQIASVRERQEGGLSEVTREKKEA